MNGLSHKGRNSILETVKKGVFEKIDVFCSSEEKKAYSTAKIIADTHRKEIIKLPNFDELDRCKGGFLANYESAVREAFSNFHESRNNWESCRGALQRFKECVETINQQHEGKKILIVSHGIVLTLYFAFLRGEMHHLFSGWRRLDFLSYGIVENSTIIKDIIE